MIPHGTHLVKGLGVQSWTKHLQTFSLFSTFYLHRKWNGTRLLWPESKCTGCLTSCRTTQDLGSQENRKFQENPWNAWIYGEYPTVNPKAKFWRVFGKNLQKVSCKKFHRKKAILLNFVNLSPTFSPRLSEETNFPF